MNISETEIYLLGAAVYITRMLHNSLVRRLACPLIAGLFEPIAACALSSHG